VVELNDLGFTEGMIIGMSKPRNPEGTRVFDWAKAARLIREHKPVSASAGLAEDWACTSGYIYNDKGPVDIDNNYTFLSSFWATPVIDMDYGGEKKNEIIECWVFSKDTNWTCYTSWPDEALAILNAPEN